MVLSFPYKDCLLEGGQTKDDQKREEIFYNATLAPDEVDRLLYPKVLINAQRYFYNGTVDITGNPVGGENTVSAAPTTEFTDNDNLIIKGNNLIAIASLLKRYEGMVKCIYIDPPYNTGTDGFNYNDRFNHSTWLVFMKNRIELAWRLLSSDGSIWITLDDKEAPYMRVLLDSIVGRNHYITAITWQHSDSSNNNAEVFSEDYNTILVYAKSEKWKPKFLNDPEKRKHYKNPDNDPRGPWFDGGDVSNPGLRPNLQFDIITPSGKTIAHPANGWRWSRETMDKMFATGELRFSEDETRVIKRRYLADMAGLPPSNLWINLKRTGHTRAAKYEQKALFPGVAPALLFSTPKPELLLDYIYDLATDEGDLVLDFFMGSATSQAVALKKHRIFIGVEQMDYVDTYSIPRLKKVIEGEQGGISKSVDWQGGGSFIYCELAKCNQRFVDEVLEAKIDTDLYDLLERILSTGFISSKVNPTEIAGASSEFETLPIEEKKRFILELLDKNMLYVNLCDMDDEEYAISDTDKAFTRSFYGLEDK
ncbi:site-specific DNA-methyltransferase [Heliophilum fasciatum]|uniref:Adenine-specific DNA-methyltransferase n=1 Tax=Heliophilum fasciatum TaxID=35700 RepID=A0A4R2R8X1_9FIRM|nr:site-specific DNA-methyltransferase [Heliophilum fasciatum]MCW2279512.1 adenine-specific DNA-methyltransferase [Heliophilum fasciatum]TCP58664.1 adenine-specific DNA-methyltransferase [Heliophilum fasciatum]